MLSLQEAADFLSVSKSFLLKELKAGKIIYKKEGAHKRIEIEDLLKYKNAIDHQRRKTLDELTAEAQRLGLGY